MDYAKLSALMRIARGRRGLSTYGVWRQARISPTAIRNLEHGRGLPNLHTLVRLAECYGYKLSEILARCEDPEMTRRLQSVRWV